MAIEILIKKDMVEGGTTETAAETPSPTNRKAEPKPKKTQADKNKELAMAHVVSITKNALMTSLNDYGDFSGNALDVRGANTLINVASMGVMLATAGPLVGGVVIAGTAVLSAIKSATNNAREQRQINYNNVRLGGILNGGNR